MTDRKPLFSVTMADLTIQTFACGGKGGSGKDTGNAGVRLIHEPSGARGECREERSQHQNKRIAFLRLANSKQFQAWARAEVVRRTGILKAVEAAVGKAMEPENLRVEVKTDRGWEPAA